MNAKAVCLIMLPGLLGPDPGGGAQAAALSVAPISLTIAAPGGSTVLTLHNREAYSINVQVRTFRWTQAEGADRLDPTTALIASPPIAAVGPNGTAMVRLQHVAEAGGGAEEAYRVVVDELPDLARRRNGAVTVLLRYSVPLFVGAPEASPPRLTWRLSATGSAPILYAANGGDQRIQISALTLKAGRRSVSVAPGLAGYVLGHATRRWRLPAGQIPAGPIRVSSGSDHGPIDAALAP